MISEQDLLSRFEGVGRQGEGDWLVRCPAHDDERPSLHVTRGEDRWLLHCLAGCQYAEVLAAAGLTPADVGSSNGREPIAVYVYTDEHSTPLFEVGRFEPKRFLQRLPGRADWKGGIGRTRRVLYRLPQVLAAVKEGQAVWIAEGEEDVHALERAGVAATCNPAGASKWRDEYSEALVGATVTIVADRDEPGMKHAQAVGRSLDSAGATVRIVQAAAGKDARDHLAAGRGLDEFELIEGPHSGPATGRKDRTDRTVSENPVNTGAPAFGPRPNGDRTPPNGLALDPCILDRHDELMGVLGLIGERHISRLAYLTHTSRLLAKPARCVIKGDSSTGKSFAVECSLKAAAPEMLYVRTQLSPLAMFYSEDDFRHRTIVFYEANKLGDDDDPLARVLRTLISEGRLAYEVTVPEKRSSQLLEKEGPVAFITTTVKASLDKEIETRILSVASNNTDEQTVSVVRSILEAANETPSELHLAEWHELDRWLASGPREVVVPWARTLAKFNLSGPPRLRRDIDNLLSLARAHALLHGANREADAGGRIVSTLEDYEVVVSILGEAMAIATEKAVRSGTREIVEAVAELRKNGPASTISLKAAARQAKRSPSTTHTDAHDALDRGYLVNRSQRDRSFDLDVGDPLPDKADLLPSREELEAQMAETVRSNSATVRYPTERASSVNTGVLGDRSVRSVDTGPGIDFRSGQLRERPEDSGDPGDEIRPEACTCSAWTARMPDDTCQKCGGAKDAAPEQEALLGRHQDDAMETER